jgi:hypothetical protein
VLSSLAKCAMWQLSVNIASTYGIVIGGVLRFVSGGRRGLREFYCFYVDSGGKTYYVVVTAHRGKTVKANQGTQLPTNTLEKILIKPINPAKRRGNTMGVLKTAKDQRLFRELLGKAAVHRCALPQ